MRSPELFDGFCHLKQRSNKTTKRRFLGPCKNMGWLTVKRNLSMVLVLFAGLVVATSTTCKAQGVSIMQDGRVDHSAYDVLLKKYVDKEGRVAYQKWKDQDEATLDGYLEAIGQVDPVLLKDDNEGLVFWINIYNALTLKAMLHFYPTKSIRDHVRVFGYNIWKELPLRVGGDEYSLEQIEHDILRKMKEPRIHFAIVCASVGCPRLRYEAYAASKIEKQLADNATDFFSRQQNLQVKPSRKSLRVSMILDWFADDFGSTQKKRWTYLKPYLPASAQAFAADGKTRISFLEYDWELNDQSKKKRTASRR